MMSIYTKSLKTIPKPSKVNLESHHTFKACLLILYKCFLGKLHIQPIIYLFIYLYTGFLLVALSMNNRWSKNEDLILVGQSIKRLGPISNHALLVVSNDVLLQTCFFSAKKTFWIWQSSSMIHDCTGFIIDMSIAMFLVKELRYGTYNCDPSLWL